MAKKKKKGAGSKDVDEMSKSELKAYHKEICEFYLENGWRETLSNFKLSPKQGAAIIPKKARSKRKELEKDSKKKAPKKAPKKKASKAKKKKGKKADAEPEAKAPKKKAKKKAAKKKKGKPGRPPKKTAGKQKIQAPSDMDGALGWLLDYRNTNGPGITLDEAIVDLMLRSRAA